MQFIVAVLLSLIFFGIPILWILVFPFRIMFWGKRYILLGVLVLALELYAGVLFVRHFPEPTGVKFKTTDELNEP